MEGFGETIHIGDAAFFVVRVLIALAVVEFLHELRGCIAEVEGDGLLAGGFDIGEDFAVAGVEGVGFGREGEEDGGFGEGQIAFG